jgi:hypothetical protein
LESSAQLLTFSPGLYAVDFLAPQSARTDSGLRLPCARIEPLPPAPGQDGRCYVSVMADGGWISQSDQPVFIRAVGNAPGAILTIYKPAGPMPAPEFRIRRLTPDAAAMAVSAPRAVPSAAADGEASLPLMQLVHIQKVGDVQAPAPEWAGNPGSARQVEGFAITSGGDLTSDDFEYQAILGEDWNTPWAKGGAFCGSRGMGLPLLGFRARLIGAAAEAYECRYWASFANKGVIGPVQNGAACEADRAFMEALRVVVRPREHALPKADAMAPQTNAPAPRPLASKPLAAKSLAKQPTKPTRGRK